MNISIALAMVGILGWSTSALFAQTQEEQQEKWELRAEQMQQQKYEIMQVNSELFQGGAEAIQKWVAEDAVFAAQDGVWAIDKEKLLKEAKNKNTSQKNVIWFSPAKLNIIQVTPQGSTAVVVGYVTRKGKINKSVITSRSHFVNVFAKREGRWQLISLQTDSPTTAFAT